MTTIKEMVFNAILKLAEESVMKEKTGFIELWMLKNGRVKIEYDRAESFLQEEQAKGFDLSDIKAKAYLSTHNAWFTWLGFSLENKNSGRNNSFGNVQWLQNKTALTKQELEEATAGEMALIKENRERILGNKEEALKVNFFQNNLEKMKIDQDTHDYILQVRKEKEEAEKTAKEQAKESLRQWALQNGSELLTLRIEEGFNWFQLANDEYFISILPEGFESMPSPAEDWPIKNAGLEQIKALREVKKNYPDAKLVRYKYDLATGDEDEVFEEEADRYEHKDVIQIALKSLSGDERTFQKEVTDL